MRRTKEVKRKLPLFIGTDGQLEVDQVSAILNGRPRMVISCLPEAEIIIQSHGWFRVCTRDKEYGQRVADWLKGNIGKEVKVSETFLGLVVGKMDIGSFLALTVNSHGVVVIEGLLHFSRYPETPFAVGDLVEVQINEIDWMGRVSLKAV